MDTNKISYFEKIETPDHQSFVLMHNNCVLCGSTLELNHYVDYDEQSIHEEAYCPQCEVKARDKLHQIQ